MEPSVRWEVESLPNNGGIYKMLLKGGKDAYVELMLSKKGIRFSVP